MPHPSRGMRKVARFAIFNLHFSFPNRPPLITNPPSNDTIAPEGAHFVAGNSKKYEERIIRDPGVCGGESVFKGTRVTLRTVLANLAAGDYTEELLADFPTLKPEDVRAAIAFAAASAEEDLPVPAIPHIQ